MGNVTDIGFFFVRKTEIFLFGFIEALDSKGLTNTLNRYYVSHRMR